jgi:superfamily II DNA or RNA helicase
MVKILIGNSTSKIVGYLPEEVHCQIDKNLSYSPPGAQHSKAVKDGKWDGVIRLYKKSYGQLFNSGLVSIVQDILKENNIEYSRIDERIKPKENLPNLKFTPAAGYQERDYQRFTIDRAYQRTRGILKVATGGGKTMITTELIAKIKTAPFMFYVLTKDLMNQAYDTLSSTLNENIGRIGGGIFDIQNINVCTIQTAIRSVNLKNKKFKISDYQFDEEDVWDKDDIVSEDKLIHLNNLLKATKGIYMDESHHASSKTCMDVIGASPNAYWRFGGTATPYREDGAEIVLQSLFGKKIVDISASYLINNGFLLEPYIFFEPIEDNCLFNSYQKIYSNCISKNEEFNIHVADTANYLVENGLITLILVQHINHGEALNKLIPGSRLVTGSIPTKKREEAIQDLRDRKYSCMIATCLADEGLDIPTLDAVLLAGGGASATRVHQRIGRTLRIDRKAENPRDKSIVIYYKHDAKYLSKHANKALKIMKTEPRFKILKSKGRDHIIREISEAMNFPNKPKTIFDI